MRGNNSEIVIRSETDLALIVEQVARAVQANVIICVTHSGALAQHLAKLSLQPRLVAATVNEETHALTTKAGLETIRLPLYAADKYSQVRHVLSVAVRSGEISTGDFVVCAIGSHVYPEEGDLIDNVDKVFRLVLGEQMQLTLGFDLEYPQGF